MAQRTRVELVDDIDGKTLKDGAGETVSFALDGSTYEIDLSKRNADKFRDVFQDYIASGRRVGGARTRRVATAGARRSRGYDPKAVRKWAASNKIALPARGRIPGAVLERYKAAGN